jgi:hypothetical protein
MARDRISFNDYGAMAQRQISLELKKALSPAQVFSIPSMPGARRQMPGEITHSLKPLLKPDLP